MTDRLVWIDCEMTGLDVGTDVLIEIAALVTDFDLNVLGDGVDLVIKPPPGALDELNEIVRTMHTASGLLDELDNGCTVEEAEKAVLDYVREYVPEPGKAPLAGNTVSTDRMFLALEMPELESHLHYRIVDVSSIKELARRWYPRAYFASPTKTGNHRALGDIRDSIDELRYYRAAIFTEPPGPDSETARALAAAIIGTTEPVSDEAAWAEPVSDEPVSDEPVSDDVVSEEPLSDKAESADVPTGEVDADGTDIESGESSPPDADISVETDGTVDVAVDTTGTGAAVLAESSSAPIDGERTDVEG
jgi:oligoribonuclease